MAIYTSSSNNSMLENWKRTENINFWLEVNHEVSLFNSWVNGRDVGLINSL